MLPKVLIIESREGLSSVLRKLVEEHRAEPACFHTNREHPLSALLDLLQGDAYKFVIINYQFATSLSIINLLEVMRAFVMPFALVSTEGTIGKDWYQDHALWSLEITSEMKDDEQKLLYALTDVFVLPIFQSA